MTDSTKWASTRKTAAFRSNLVFLGLIALAMVVLAAIVAYQHALRLVELGKEVAHTHEILAELEATESLIRDVETAQRGYVVIHEDFLLPYKEALQKVALRVNKLARLVADNPDQKDNVSQLQSEMKNEFAFAAKVVAARSEKKINEVLQEIESGRGNRFTDSIRQRLRDMRIEEKFVLIERTGSLNDSSNQMILTVALLGLISGALLLLLIFSANMYLKERTGIEAMSAAQYDVAKAVAESGEIEKTILALLEGLCLNLGWSTGACWRPDKFASNLDCQIFFQLKANDTADLFSESKRVVPVNSNDFLAEVYNKRDCIWLDDLNNSRLYQRTNAALAVKMISALAIPVFTQGKVSAVFEFFSDEKKEADEHMLDTLNTVCNQLTQFIHRRQSEDALGESQARLHGILTNMAEAVFVVNKLGNLTESNPAAEALLGPDLLKLTVHEWTESLGIYDQSKSTNYPVKDLAIFRAMRGEQVDGEEMFIRNNFVPSGLWVSATGRPLRDEQGELIGGIMVLRDINERKLAEKRVSEFYSMVSHELRTPLTSIRASLGLMQGGVVGNLSEMAQQLVDIGREECDRLIRLINDILDIRKIEAGKLELKLEVVEPAQLIRIAIEGIRSMAEENKITLESRLDTEEKIICDKDRILQVLTNLISNAVKFSAAENEVLVKVELLNGVNMRFSIEDHGTGIASDQVQKLFQKFQQLDQSDSRRKGGTGLGLAICKAIIEEHGGKINVQTQLGSGSIFYFDLPIEPGLFIDKPVV